MKVTKPRACGYLVTITITSYATSLALHSLTPNPGVEAKLIEALLLLAVLWMISRIFLKSQLSHADSSDFASSLIHVLTLLAVGNAIPLAIMLTSGPERMFVDAKPSFIDKWSTVIPAFAVLYWGIFSIIVAYIYHSAAYELFGGKTGIAASFLLFTINYNLPLVSGYWNLWDILFFGAAFSYSYSVNRNPRALASAYLISEVPLWWCILAPLGAGVFAAYFAARFAASVAALIALAWKRFSRK
ncbi:hypothetical protein GAH_00442 [Geoglobus ahangari]|uniref:Uncharacterized protein n=1 Tax=Geoglobus ahangari TaxID=113653 RepID=A0A0F7DC46_9EURY|nr:hypothetical protein [Geoglobus ahangari]AKG92206.1 hypothetical protein GAH_00442 [Geoglobus ahangari]